MLKLADLIEKNAEELALLESVNVGKPFMFAKMIDVSKAV
jgi:acyl-CoA reductase-like NAD-dependent aldehyde dehydrogenase